MQCICDDDDTLIVKEREEEEEVKKSRVFKLCECARLTYSLSMQDQLIH